MEKIELKITPKKFKRLSQWAEDVYNMVVIIDYFISNQAEIKECYNLAPVINI